MSKKNQDEDIAFITALAEILKNNDLGEVEVERNRGEDTILNVRLTRNIEQAPQILNMAPTHATPMMTPDAKTSTSPLPPVTTQEGDPAKHPGAVKSPMVGTVYLQAEPDAEPFISIGTMVSEGATLLIIEAMKTMNHIPSPKSGTVKRVLVEDGGAVEFGTPLVIIE